MTMRCGDYGYRLIDSGAEILEYDGLGGDVTVPDDMDGHAVVSIGLCAFVARTAVTGVTLPRTVRSIAFGAFEGCTALERVEFPAALESVGFRSFANCHALQSALLPDTVMVIEDGAFNGCTALREVHIPARVKVIPQDCFIGCASLTEVTLPEGLERIHPHAFTGCSGLQTLKLPQSLTEIGTAALTGCPRLTDLRLPEHFALQRRALRLGYGVYWQDETVIVGNYGAIPQKDGTLFIEEYEGDEEHVALPASIGGKPVTRFSQNLFACVDAPKTLSLPRCFTSDTDGIPWGTKVTIRA
ncbi:MAG: leucine-rich repeat protein [Clostridia bacterium]|nr:leucine-rich repeat protein [Clostridia bacterium]